MLPVAPVTRINCFIGLPSDAFFRVPLTRESLLRLVTVCSRNLRTAKTEDRIARWNVTVHLQFIDERRRDEVVRGQLDCACSPRLNLVRSEMSLGVVPSMRRKVRVRCAASANPA